MRKKGKNGGYDLIRSRKAWAQRKEAPNSFESSRLMLPKKKERKKKEQNKCAHRKESPSITSGIGRHPRTRHTRLILVQKPNFTIKILFGAPRTPHLLPSGKKKRAIRRAKSMLHLPDSTAKRPKHTGKEATRQKGVRPNT